MITFYPGPSKVYPQVVGFVKDAHDSGILSANHRSGEFMELMENTIREMKIKLLIPENYTVFFTSSATECWEIIAQSLISKSTLHLFNGAFGEKWFQNTKKINPSKLIHSYAFSAHHSLTLTELEKLAGKNPEMICFTQNETSNGTCLAPSFIRQLRDAYPQSLLAVDATSSMAGISLPFECADLWFASVQKCFGLPSGMAVMLCSPKAVEKALEMGEKEHYNSLSNIIENSRKFQTPYTPNVLGIYLLHRILQMRPIITETDLQIRKQADDLYAFFEKQSSLKLLVDRQAARSPTVLALISEKEKISVIKEKAREQNIILGNGYGEWKENSIRIANFPAIESNEIEQLKDFIISMA